MTEQNRIQTLEEIVKEHSTSQLYHRMLDKKIHSSRYRTALSQRLKQTTGKTMKLDGAPNDIVDGASEEYVESSKKKVVDYAKEHLNSILEDNPSEFLLQYAIEATVPSEASGEKYKEIAGLHKQVTEMKQAIETQDINAMKEYLCDIKDPILKKSYIRYVNAYPQGLMQSYQEEYHLNKGLLLANFKKEDKINRDLVKDYLFANLSSDEEKEGFYVAAATAAVRAKTKEK